jgi:hypothetical protein
LNEALRIHGGPAWRVFQVCDFSPGFAVFPPSFLPRLRFPDPCPFLFCPPTEGVRKSGPREIRCSRPAGCRAQLVPGAVQRPRHHRRGLEDP